MQTWTVTTPFHPTLRCLLGEGPHHEPATSTIRFIDIKSNTLHTITPTIPTPLLTSLTVSDRITVTADIADVDPASAILVGAKYGLAKLNRKSGALTYVAGLLDRNERLRNERLRTNDGAVGPDGRFWLGFMTDFGYGEFQPEGGYVSYIKGEPTRHFEGYPITIPNTIGWSPDLSTMYLTHSSSRVVYAFDYNATTHTYSNKRSFYQHNGPGEPDGFRVDTEGNVWHAVYGEGKVLKISPKGEVIGEVRVPTRNITCVEFVGTELFITTAADEDGDEQSKANGGAVFMVDVGAQGLKPFKYIE